MPSVSKLAIFVLFILLEGILILQVNAVGIFLSALFQFLFKTSFFYGDVNSSLIASMQIEPHGMWIMISQYYVKTKHYRMQLLKWDEMHYNMVIFLKVIAMDKKVKSNTRRVQDGTRYCWWNSRSIAYGMRMRDFSHVFPLERNTPELSIDKRPYIVRQTGRYFKRFF